MKPPIDNFSLLSYSAGPVTQYFGENPALYRTINLAYHNGIDFVAPHGSQLYAVEDGTVVNVNNDPEGFGKHVRFISHGRGTLREWTYGHCHEIFVKVGDQVKAGQKIATMGNTGFVVSGATPFWKHNPFAGTHLHLGLRLVKLDPKGWAYPGSLIKISVLDSGNGVRGAIDPAPTLATIGFIDPQKTQRKQMLTIISLLNTMVRLLKDKKK